MSIGSKFSFFLFFRAWSNYLCDTQWFSWTHGVLRWWEKFGKYFELIHSFSSPMSLVNVTIEFIINMFRLLGQVCFGLTKQQLEIAATHRNKPLATLKLLNWILYIPLMQKKSIYSCQFSDENQPIWSAPQKMFIYRFLTKSEQVKNFGFQTNELIFNWKMATINRFFSFFFMNSKVVSTVKVGSN